MLLNMVLTRIVWLFEKRLASPDDVDESNETIMHGVMQMVQTP